MLLFVLLIANAEDDVARHQKGTRLTTEFVQDCGKRYSRHKRSASCYRFVRAWLRKMMQPDSQGARLVTFFSYRDRRKRCSPTSERNTTLLSRSLKVAENDTSRHHKDRAHPALFDWSKVAEKYVQPDIRKQRVLSRAWTATTFVVAFTLAALHAQEGPHR